MQASGGNKFVFHKSALAFLSKLVQEVTKSENCGSILDQKVLLRSV